MAKIKRQPWETDKTDNWAKSIEYGRADDGKAWRNPKPVDPAFPGSAGSIADVIGTGVTKKKGGLIGNEDGTA
jgi:hypothetical protein